MVSATSDVTKGMEPYLDYARFLDALISMVSDVGFENCKSEVAHALNGGASEALRSHVKLSKLKQHGAFFTTEKIAQHAIAPLAQKVGGSVFDPACGAGDLLLRWAENLPLRSTLERTLQSWGDLLAGTDINPEFIAVAKRRLILCALSKNNRWSMSPDAKADDFFPALRIRDFFDEECDYRSTLVMNPPFSQQQINESWASGKTSLAAVFFMRALHQLSKGQRIAAILPEVLRSGSRYAKWRKIVGDMLQFERFESLGKFSNLVDVDVFLLQGQRGEPKIPNLWNQKVASLRLESLCDVKVGTVVPHRDKQCGPLVRYLCTSSLPSDGEFSGGDYRNVSSRTVQTPFVAVRRTSSPSDRTRPVATIVTGEGPVALENHLISLRPHDGTLSACRQIYELLRSQKTRTILDETIRCRHLTTSAIKNLPI